MDEENCRVLEIYSDGLFGIPVVIHNAVVERVDGNGETWIAFPDEYELNCAIAIARAMHPVRLQPADIVMMRKALALRQGAFAKRVHIDPARMSRLEKGVQAPGRDTEMRIRLYVAAMLAKRAPAIVCDFEALATLGIVEPPPGGEQVELHFERVTLKSAETGAKSREWDLVEAPETSTARAAA